MRHTADFTIQYFTAGRCGQPVSDQRLYTKISSVSQCKLAEGTGTCRAARVHNYRRVVSAASAKQIPSLLCQYGTKSTEQVPSLKIKYYTVLCCHPDIINLGTDTRQENFAPEWPHQSLSERSNRTRRSTILATDKTTTIQDLFSLPFHRKFYFIEMKNVNRGVLQNEDP
jgi:hypothetical protein